MRTRIPTGARLVRLATAFDKAAEPADEFVLPESLDDLTDDDLAALEQQAVDAFDGIREADAPLTEDALTALESLADAVEAIRAEQTARTAAADAAAERAAALADRVTPKDQETAEDDADPATGDDDADATAEGDLGDVEASEDGSGVDDAAVEAGIAEAEAAANEPAPVAASGGRRGPISVSLAGIKRRAPQTTGGTADDGPRATIVAAADSGHPVGDRVELRDLAEAWLRKAPALTAAARSGARMNAGLGTIEYAFPREHVIDGTDGTDAVDFATDEANLPGGSLIAAGGFCAPSEQMYDLCDGRETTAGIVNLPEVNLTRGSVSIFGGFDLSDVFADDQQFNFTNADDEAGDYDGNGGPKPCVRVPCLDPRTIELDGQGMCVQTGILQARNFPETVTRFVEVTLNAYAHRRNRDTIADMEAAATGVTMPASDGATAHVLGSIELIVEHMRHRNRETMTQTYEALIPSWLTGTLRSDLAKRMGVDLWDVDDARLNAALNRRGIRSQEVYDWQDGRVDAGIALGGDTAPTAWPDEVKVLIYPGGEYVRYTGGRIDVNAIVDQDLVLNNDEHVLFFEEFFKVDKRGCYDAYVVTIPLCPDGSTQGGIDLACDRA